MRRSRIITGLLVSMAAYLAAFTVVFDPLSSPCRTREKWIGPKLRFDGAYVDLGKVFEYQRPSSWAYVAFYPLCRGWLSLNGLDEPKEPNQAVQTTPRGCAPLRV